MAELLTENEIERLLRIEAMLSGKEKEMEKAG